jgi:CRISPR-associated protein Cas2
MADAEMLTVFVYDVAHPRTRRKLSGFFEEFAVRVQKSVFETRLTAARTGKAAAHAAAMLQPGDSLRVYAIAADGRPRCQSFGGTPMLENEPYYLL